MELHLYHYCGAQTRENAMLLEVGSTLNAATMVIEGYTRIRKAIITNQRDWLVTHMNDKVRDWLDFCLPM
jgi:hypothetical protein